MKEFAFNLLLPLISTTISLASMVDAQGDQRIVVMIENGAVEGKLIDGVRMFKGMPYASPPVDSLRWRAPQPVKSWNGVRKAHKYGPVAPQKNSKNPNQSEDCLYINVWTPESKPTNDKYPVMVWIHGGGFVSGSGAIAGENFAKKGVVFVSFNYRLGRFGSFAHPALTDARKPDEPPANFWLQDQVAALQWVRTNIDAFDGNPDQVTIFGVSAGGASVNQLMSSPLSKELFHRAIAQSGVGGFGPLRRLDRETNGRQPLMTIGTRFAEHLGILGSGPEAAKQLMELPWRTIAMIDESIPESDGDGFEPVVDGISLLDDTQKIFESGRQHPVPFLSGYNSFEGNLTLVYPWTHEPPREEIMKNIAELAPLYHREPGDSAVWEDIYGDLFFGASSLTLLRAMEQINVPAWSYYFDYVRSRGANSRGAGHGSEVPYVFDMVLFPSAQDRKVIQTIQGHWIQFAKTGDPNGPGLPKWPKYTQSSPVTFIYGQEAFHSTSDWLSPRFDILFSAVESTWPKSSSDTENFQSTNSSILEHFNSNRPQNPINLSAQSENELRENVASLFDALRSGNIQKFIDLADPEVIHQTGIKNTQKYFKTVSGLIVFSNIRPEDRSIRSIAWDEKSQLAEVTIELIFKNGIKKSAIEVWKRTNGNWVYRESK